MLKSRTVSSVKFFVTQCMALVLIFNFSCEKSTESDPDNQVSINGSWELARTMTSNTCGIENGAAETEVIYISDTSGVLTIINFGGNWGTATLTGSTVQFAGSEETVDFGCPTTLITTGTGSVYGQRITGSLNTTVIFNPDSCGQIPDCQINTDFTMTKMEESDCYNRAAFGDPQNSKFILPYPPGTAYRIYQSYCWPTGGHRNQLAYDFTMPIGDSVLATRSGTVREVREDSPDDGQGYGEHNFVRIEHDDGTLAFYAHLMQNSVVVQPGENIVQGQYIALSGNSGQSGEPHLHLGVYETYPPVEGKDVAINFKNASGPLDDRGGLIRGEEYTALPF